MISLVVGALVIRRLHAREGEGFSLVQTSAGPARETFLKQAAWRDDCPYTTDGGALHGISVDGLKNFESHTAQLQYQKQIETEQNQQGLLSSSESGSACPSSSNERVVVQAVVHPYHGSTSVLQLLMSSPKVATLCTAMTWQCEGGWLIRDTIFADVPKLDVFSKFWDLRQPVFFEKATDLYWGDKPNWPENLQRITIEPYDDQQITKEMQGLGITHLKKAFILMWRPYCLKSMSSHIVGAGTHGQLSEDILGNKTSPEEFTEEVESYEEYLRYQELLDGYNKLVGFGIDVVLINYGDMLFNPGKVAQRLQAFLPCIGELSATHVPQRDQDMYKCNRWKPIGSIEDYGNSMDPASLKYDVQGGHCLPDYDVSVAIKDPKYASLAQEAVSKLRDLTH